MKVYKLTDASMKTRGGFQWELGVERKVKPYTGEECSDGAMHSYSDPLLAVFMNPTHSVYDTEDMRMFEANTGRRYKRERLKIVSEKLTIVKEIKVPELSPLQRLEAAIKMAKLVCKDEKWNSWANDWLSGEDRSREANYSDSDASDSDTLAAAAAAHAAHAADLVAYAAAAHAAHAADLVAYSAAAAASDSLAAVAAFYAFCAAAHAAAAASDSLAAVAAGYADYAADLVGREFTRRSVEILHNLKEK
jgi:hypothetical protein